jgi:hypothetical protein
MEDWLQQAKRLAVGQSQRYRCCGRTPAGVLYNKVDSWQMYCFRCHQSAREMKQYVSLVPQEVLPKDLAPPSDLQKLDTLPEYMQTTLYSFLINRGIWPHMAGDVYYSEQYKRLVWKLSTGSYIARALHEYQFPKWVMLGKSLQWAQLGNTGTITVLTEDYLSALKVQQVSEKYSSQTVTAIALLGTRLALGLKAQLIREGKPVVCMLDDDSAGWNGTASIIKQLKPFLPVHDRHLDVDPKAANVKQILGALDGFCNC